MASSYPPHLAYARVSWQRELRFDGRKARCDGEVEVRGPAQLLRTSALSASLATPIDLRAYLLLLAVGGGSNPSRIGRVAGKPLI